MAEAPRQAAARDLDDPGASAALDDLLSRLRIGITSEGLDGDQALAFELTNFLGLSVDSGYKVQVVARPAQVYEPLSKLLSGDARKKRSDSLNDFDDLLATFSYSPTTANLGRNLGAFQRLSADLYSAALARANSLDEERNQAENDLGRVDSDVAGASGIPPELFDDNQEFIGRFDQVPDPALAARYRDAYERAETVQQKRLKLILGTLETTQFFRFADLVANQPQLIASAKQTFRDDLVGPEESMASLSFEMGFVNVNSLRKATSTCKKGPLDCYGDYLTAARLKDAAKENRLKFSVEWSKVKDYRIAIDGVNLDREGKDRLTGLLSYSRNLRVKEDGTVDSRIDLTGTYEDWSDDPMHQDRALATLSFTQRLNQEMSVVLGAVWASKPEFRGAVDKEVSARFGLTYRLVNENAAK